MLPSYFMVEFVKNSVATIKGADGLVGQVTVFLQQVFRNKEMWIIIAASVICLFVVSALRKMSCNHAWEIAIVSYAGAPINPKIIGIAYGIFKMVDSIIKSITIAVFGEKRT